MAAITFGINFTRHFEPVRVGQILIRSSDSENDGVWPRNILHEHVADLALDVAGLVSDGNLYGDVSCDGIA